MANKKAAAIWDYMIWILIGLVGMTIIITLYYSASERGGESLTDLLGTSKISCDEKCIIDGHSVGNCKDSCSSGEENVGQRDCPGVFTCCCVT